jgi:hypothetical protein
MAPNIFSVVCMVVAALFFRNLAKWIIRIRGYRKTMPTVHALFPPDSQYRLIWPKKWQTFHKDWHMQYHRSIYQKLDSDIFAVVCFFQYDKVFICDPAAVLDVNIVKPREFPRDMIIAQRVSTMRSI